MAYFDRVSETVAVSGTGPVALGTASPGGYQTFAAVLANGALTPYCIADATAGAWETGIGTFASGPPASLTRTLVLASSAGGDAVNFAGNACAVFITEPAAAYPRRRLPWIAGNWYGSADNKGTAGTPQASKLYAMYVPIDDPYMPSAIGVYCTTAPAAATALELGWYGDAGGRPGPLLHDAGSVSVSAVGLASIALAGVLVTPPGLWAALGTPAALNGMALAAGTESANWPGLFQFGSAAGPANAGGLDTQAGCVIGAFASFGALPQDFPAPFSSPSHGQPQLFGPEFRG